MNLGVSLFELVAPLVMVLFASGFFYVWNVNRAEVSSGMIGGSYIFAASAFFFEFLRNVLPAFAYISLTNGLYTLTAVTFVIGMTFRAGNRPQYWLVSILGITTIVSILVLSALGFGSAPQTIVAHLGNGMIFAVGVYSMRGPRWKAIDRAIFSLCVLNVVQLVMMPIGFALFQALPQTLDEYRSHSFLTSFQLIVSCSAILVAMLLLIDYATNMIDRFRTEATHDKLTGILNRRGFEDRAARLLRAADARGEEIGFIIADLDNFKQVNDTYGHGFGDKVIVALARLFENHLSDKGSAGRLGGEEFIMVKPVGSLDEARAFADLMRIRWERYMFEEEGVSLSFTASFGVSSRLPGESITAALVRADDALYLAKESGRNCTKCQHDTSVARLKAASADMRYEIPGLKQVGVPGQQG